MSVYFDNSTLELTDTRSEFDQILIQGDHVNFPCRIEDRTTSARHLGVSLEIGGYEMVPGEWVVNRYRIPTEQELEDGLKDCLEESNDSLFVDIALALVALKTQQRVVLGGAA